MRVLQIDIETYSSTDLISCGVYRYVEAPDFEILLFAYAYDDEPVQIVDLTAFEDLPDHVIADLVNPKVIKTAYNANFERTCISKHFGIPCDPAQWHCTMVWSLTLGLPASLEKAAQVLMLKVQKDTKGKNLIKYFSVPCKPTKANGEQTRNYPYHDPEKWEEFKAYNIQDVVVEREIRKRLECFPVPEHEWRLWALDQRINDTGVRMDPELARQALICYEQFKNGLLREAVDITGLDNPNSLIQLKAWLAEQGLETPEGMGKEHIPGLLENAPDEDTRRMLEIRRHLGKTSVDKYAAMERSVCPDGRIRGVFQFCGANRTGRWAGRIFQPHNLPKNKIEDLGLARKILRDGDFALLKLLYGPPPPILSQLIRTALIPSEGHQFIVADFSAIEARIVAWLADENWVLTVFRGHGKIYEATAAQMFKVPMETIAKGHANYSLRAKGKVAVLACGYQGGPVALIKMGALKDGIPEEELPGIIKQWRTANSNIVTLWSAVEEAAITAVKEKTTVPLKHGVQFRYKAGILFADLPSGRSLAYPEACIKTDPRFGKEGVVFKTMKGNWGLEHTYGGKLVENLVQAIARDCLAESMIRLAQEGYKIVMHVHDEVVLEVPKGQEDVKKVCQLMCIAIPWAPELPLSAAGFECEFYQKD